MFRSSARRLLLIPSASAARASSLSEAWCNWPPHNRRRRRRHNHHAASYHVRHHHHHHHHHHHLHPHPHPSLFDVSASRRLLHDGPILIEQGTSRYWVRPAVRSSMDANVVEKGLVKGADVYWKDAPRGLKLRRRAHIAWEDDSPPQRVLVVKKPANAAATALLREFGAWLASRGLTVYVERPVIAAGDAPPGVREFSSSCCSEIDFAVTLGGDGTVLHLASLFEADAPLPPVMSFAMGTLGFLTPFDVTDYKSHVTRVLVADQRRVGCTLRARKRCEVRTPAGLRIATHHTLNECIIDRGPSCSTVTVEIFVDGQYVTTVVADGLIVATPSGSTAYSMTAGGPMVAPSVPCSLVTPVAPLSLSFRPLVVPETSDIVVRVSEVSKAIGRATFDGRHQARLVRGGSVRITTSMCPLPLINVGELDSDWYEGITQKLKWNQSIIEPPRGSEDVPNAVGAMGREEEVQTGADERWHE